jgi:hypothetical protein
VRVRLVLATRFLFERETARGTSPAGIFLLQGRRSTPFMQQDAFVIRSEEEVREIVRRFENCVYTPAEFQHRLHLVVTTWYVFKMSEAAALSRMRQNLRRFSECHQAKGYHETITRFWVRVVAHFVDSVDSRRELPLTVIISDVVAVLGDKRYIYSFYTAERLMSEEARGKWLAPDLRPLESTHLSTGEQAARVPRD